MIKNPPLGPHIVFHNAFFFTVQNTFVEVSVDHHSWCMIPSVSKSTTNIIFDLEHNILAISCQSDELTGHRRLHPLGLESYWNIQDSPLVMTLFTMLSSFQFIQQGQWRFCFTFWSCTRIMGTIFTYTFLTYNSSSYSCQLIHYSFLAPQHHSHHQMVITAYRILNTLGICISFVFWDQRNFRSLCTSCLSKNLEQHSVRWIRHCWSPQTSVNIMWVLDAILLYLIKNMMLKHTLNFNRTFSSKGDKICLTQIGITQTVFTKLEHTHTSCYHKRPC
jgi:hypothetical protein